MCDIDRLIALLKKEYPEVKCALNYSEPYQLLFATRLSAQCTDVRVNMVTPELFAKYPDIPSLAAADIADVEELVKSCGLYKTKAREIVEAAKLLESDYDCTIPDIVEELIKLPGVGRKTANLICGELYGKPAVVADTHVIRLSNRIGLVASKDQLKVEKKLWELIPPEETMGFCHRLVMHGRAVCNARKPMCESCVIKCECMGYNNGADYCEGAERKRRTK